MNPLPEVMQSSQMWLTAFSDFLGKVACDFAMELRALIFEAHRQVSAAVIYE